MCICSHGQCKKKIEILFTFLLLFKYFDVAGKVFLFPHVLKLLEKLLYDNHF